MCIDQTIHIQLIRAHMNSCKKLSGTGTGVMEATCYIGTGNMHVPCPLCTSNNSKIDEISLMVLTGNEVVKG